jgi:2-polyprenyl-3-methyl-5-hydroxy-6-metoxy-1,4-benzoquinol methylase
MKLPKINCRDRLGYILENCSGKRVLHLGCASSPSTKARYDRKELLHVLVSARAKELWGIDLDSDAVSYLQEKGIPNLLIGDVEKLDTVGLLRGEKFEVILAGELIEHLLNPGLFLKQCARFLTGGGVLLLSTVNAFTIKRAPRVLFRNEATAADHTFYSTYSTLHQLLSRSGYSILEIFVYYLGKDLYLNQPLMSRLSGAVLKRLGMFNYFADGFVLKAAPAGV